VGTRDLRTLWSPSVSLNQERDKGAKQLFIVIIIIILNLLFLKSPPRNPLLADLIIATLFLLKFSISPGVCAVHRFQFQATSALWSKASNLHYSLMRLSPPPPPPSPAKHTQLFYAKLRHSRGGCQAEPSRPSMTDPAWHPHGGQLTGRECPWPSDTMKSRASWIMWSPLCEIQVPKLRSHILKINTTTTSARLLLHDLVSSATPTRENQRQNFLFENTRESQQKKKDSDLDQLQSRFFLSSLLLFSPLSSSSSSLACSSATLLLQATLFSSFLCPPPPLLSPVAAHRSSSRPHSARAGNQRTTVPAPPVLGTKERPCPFHPCRGPESQPAFCDGPGPTPPTAGRSAVCDELELRHGQT